MYRYRIVFPNAPDQQLERSDTAMIEVEEPYEVGAKITHGGKVWQVTRLPLEEQSLGDYADVLVLACGRVAAPPKLHRKLTTLFPRSAAPLVPWRVFRRPPARAWVAGVLRRKRGTDEDRMEDGGRRRLGRALPRRGELRRRALDQDGGTAAW